MMFHVLWLGLLVLSVNPCLALYTDWDTDIQCPGLFPKIFTRYTPRGNLTYAIFTEQPELQGTKQCVLGCCTAPLCNVALTYNATCFHVRCLNSEMCTPLFRPDTLPEDPPRMILVKPTEPHEMWADFLGDHVAEESGWVTFFKLKKKIDSRNRKQSR